MKSALAKLARALVPRPRRRPGLTSGLPLVIFLILFGGTCLALELRHIVVFASPGYFWLLAVTPWIGWLHVAGWAGLGALRSVVALLTRLCLVAVLVLVMAEPRMVQSSNLLSVIYALDVSHSIADPAIEQALEFVVRTAAERSGHDQAGLVVFGRDAGVELPPRLTFPFEGAINTRIAGDGTNIAKGLALAAAMLPEEHAGRIVLISDGIATAGALPQTLDQLGRDRVPVDVLPISYDFSDEVWLEKLELPQVVKVGDTYEAAIVLSSLKQGTGRLVLTENGKQICSQEIRFEAGKNRFTLPLYLRAPGYYEYLASIEVPSERDGWGMNNTAIGYLYLEGEGQALLLTDPDGDPRDWQRISQALAASEMLVTRQTAYQAPHDLMAMMPYDCVVLANTPADALDEVQMQVLHDAVADLGVGLLMVGGKNSFGPGGFHRTQLEKALPVTMDISQRKVMPKGALAIVLHTCEFAEGNTWGKRITKQAIKVLSDQDEVGVLIYGQSGARWLFPLTRAGEYQRLVALINNAAIGDMPSFATTMQMGLNGLLASDAAAKHMIIISDGDPSPPPPPLLKRFADAEVSVSTVVVFPHGGQDESMMKLIATSTGGRYYKPRSAGLLPAIFIKEAKTLQRHLIQNKTFVPARQAPSPVLKKIAGLPRLHGYVLTTPKARSLTILEGPDQEEPDPVLATWRYGLGKTAAFTSDLAPNWAADWMQWDRLDPFIKQLITEISRSTTKGHLRSRSFAANNRGIILAEDHHPEESFLDLHAQVRGPDNRTEKVTLRQVGPGRYRGETDLWGNGRYQVSVVGSGAGRDERVQSGFAVPYSAEYLHFSSDPIMLAEIAERTGGRQLSGAETGREIYPPERPVTRSSRPIFEWILVLLCCLIPLDVGVRRIQLDLAAIRSRFGRSASESAPTPATMGALLDRKREISQALPSAEAVPRSEQARPAPQPRPQAPPTETTPSAAPATDQHPGLSTTQRLLAQKRKRQQQDKEST